MCIMGDFYFKRNKFYRKMLKRIQKYCRRRDIEIGSMSHEYPLLLVSLYDMGYSVKETKYKIR